MRVSGRLGIAMVLLAGCGSEPEQGTARAAIYGGATDDPSGDAVVALRIRDGAGTRLCTGTLVSENVVLTARHCTSIPASETVLCDASGRSASGNQFLADVEPSSIEVHVGVSPSVGGRPGAVGRQVFRPASNAFCDSDVALVVLDRAILGVRPLPVRLHGAVAAGEAIRAVGYGEDDSTWVSGVRRRADVRVLAVGPSGQGGTVLGPNEIEVGRAVCHGDSGGPALSARTGAIVAVASRSIDCSAGGGHVYVTLGEMPALFERAFAVAGGGPLEELPAAGASRGCSASPKPAGPGASGVAAAIALLAALRRFPRRCRANRQGAMAQRTWSGSSGASLCAPGVSMTRRIRRQT